MKEEIMEKIEAMCNKNADTIFDIQYDNGLPVGVFEYEVLLIGINSVNRRLSKQLSTLNTYVLKLLLKLKWTEKNVFQSLLLRNKLFAIIWL